VNRGGLKVTRWNRRLVVGAMAVLLPALAGCEAGFNAPTLQYHPANFAGDATEHGITFSNVFVLGAASNGPAVAGGRAGVFMSLYSANGDRLVSAKAPGTASQVSITGGSVNLPAQSLVDLSGPVPQVVLAGLANPLEGGETVTLNLDFAKAGQITLSVPVEPQSFEYATFSPPPTPSPSPSATGKKKKAKASASASATASPSATP
jgi:copper(I)-binding protein